MNKSNQGFGLVEAVAVVGIVGVLAAIAVPRYQDHVVKTQHAEAVSAIESLKPQVVQSLIKSGKCPTDLTSAAKYGEVTVSGTASIENLKAANARLKTGCALNYKFNTTNVNKRLSGKVLVVDLFNNGQLSKASQTTVDAKYIPVALATITEDPKPATTITAETAYVAKDTTAIVEAPPPPTEVVVDVGSIPGLIIKQEEGYKVTPSINIYDLVTKTNPTLPPKVTIEIPVDVAIVGFTDSSLDVISKGAIIIDNRWPSATGLTIVNKGLIVGGGGDGGIFLNNNTGYKPGENGGTAIYNQSAYKIAVENYGTIAGGGGGGGLGATSSGGGGMVYGAGGGAPYGRASYIRIDASYKGKNATLLTPGAGTSKKYAGNYKNPKPFTINHGAWGGDIGTAAADGVLNNYYGIGSAGGKAGSRSEGLVTINDK